MSNAFDVAAKQIGLNERDQNAALQEYLANGGQRLDPAVTAWCAAFVNATLEQSGISGTGALNARSYLDWGQEVTEPQRGDVAVFSRGDPNGWQGHVGFFDGYNEDGTIRVLGGNQGDSVSIANYGADSLLGFRRAGNAAPTQNALEQASRPSPNALAAVQQAMTPQRNAMPQMQTNALDASAFQSNHDYTNPLMQYAGVKYA